MKLFTTSIILALFAIKTCSASAPIRAFEARQASAPIVTFYFEGPFVSTGIYADFRESIPEDGNTYPITNSTTVYSIIPDDTGSNCTFIGVDGSVHIISGFQQDIIPVALKSVTCAARSGAITTPTGFPNYSSFFPATATASATIAPPISSTALSSGTHIASYPTRTSSIANTLPPYPTATNLPSTVSPTGASASAPSGGAQSTRGSSIVPFTSNAIGSMKSSSVSAPGLISLIAAVQIFAHW